MSIPGIETMNVPKTFPISVKLNGRHVLVIGGGTVADTRVMQFLSVGAIVTVIALEASELLKRLSREKSIRLNLRPVQPSDIHSGYALLVGATNDRTTQQMIAAQARRQSVPCNIVDRSEESDFFIPAIVSRGALKIAISTDGNSPVLAGWLREKIEQALPEVLEPFVRELGILRQQLKISVPESLHERKAIIRQVLHRLEPSLAEEKSLD